MRPLLSLSPTPFSLPSKTKGAPAADQRPERDDQRGGRVRPHVPLKGVALEKPARNAARGSLLQGARGN